MRSIASDGEIKIVYSAAVPCIDNKTVFIPEPSHAPDGHELSVIRGHGDALALYAACHDAETHRKFVPPSGPARDIFEAVEQTRVESIGALQMQGMADNISAKVEEFYANGRFNNVADRDAAPLDLALSLLVREQLTGSAPPENAVALVDQWRSWVGQRTGPLLSSLEKCIEDQEAFGRVMSKILEALDVIAEQSEGQQELNEDELEPYPEDGSLEPGDDESEGGG